MAFFPFLPVDLPMPNATQLLHQIIIRNIETGPHPYAECHGYDWCDLSPEEEAVFGLSLDELPSLVRIWCTYEKVLDVCDMMDVPEDVLEGFLKEHPWLRACRVTRAFDEGDFVRFAALFRIPNRKAASWFCKHQFWLNRCGLTTYPDEYAASDEEVLF